MPNKADLRREIRRRKAAHTSSELQCLSEEVVARLCRRAEWAASHTVLLYHSLPDEVATHDLIHRAVAAGKTVLLPVVCGSYLRLRRYDRDSSLAVGAFNILEPSGSDFTAYDTIDLAIVPGMAFTPDGRRLGRGRGYYDRLLPLLCHARLIGICWPFQLLDTIPVEPHDIAMDAIVTAEPASEQRTPSAT